MEWERRDEWGRVFWTLVEPGDFTTVDEIGQILHPGGNAEWTWQSIDIVFKSNNRDSNFGAMIL